MVENYRLFFSIRFHFSPMVIYNHERIMEVLMKTFLKKLPLPITGLMLGLAALGNLLVSYGQILRNTLGALSALILLLVVLKIFTQPGSVKKALENVVVFSVFPTLSMAIMLLAVYLKPVSSRLALIMWIAGIVIHLGLMLSFTYVHIFDFSIKKVFPSWFIVYVGLVVGSITAPAFDQLAFGQLLFYFGGLSLLILLPVVARRVFILGEIPEAALPTLAIFTAPASLCLAGYISSFPEKRFYMVILLLVLSQGLYLYVLTQLPRLLKLKFSPAFSAFTFPLVITAISLKLTHGFQLNSGRPLPFLGYLVKFEELLATLVVVYVFFSYAYFLVVKPAVPKETSALPN